MKMVVIGGTGLIGSKLVQQLAGQGTTRYRPRRPPASTR